jgi:hypothetical protein
LYFVHSLLILSDREVIVRVSFLYFAFHCITSKE